MLLGIYIFFGVLWFIVWGVLYAMAKSGDYFDRDLTRLSAQMFLLTLLWPLIVALYVIKVVRGAVMDAIPTSKDTDKCRRW